MNCTKIHPDYQTRCTLAEGHLPPCQFPTMTPAAIAEAERQKAAAKVKRASPR